MTILDIDIETYSKIDLKKSNVYAYSEDASFDILMAGWSLDNSPIQVAVGEDEIREIPGLWDPAVKKVAHNAGFERVCFSRLVLPVGEYLPPEDWFDTMAVAAEHGLPRGLDDLAKALGVEGKDSAGTRLINLFCKPYRGRQVRPEDKPDKWGEFVEYCRQDVATLQAVRGAMPGWPSRFERDLWYADQRINDRGIKVDIGMAQAAVEAAEANTAKAKARVLELTTGVENPGSVPQLRVWLAERGYPLADMQAMTITQKLLDSDLPDDVREVLELRQELALVASRKYAAALRSVSIDKRLRGQFMFHAAHTGRWSSRGVQVHNLPRKAFTTEDPETGDEVTDWHTIGWKIDALKLGCGADPQDLKRLVRPMFEGPFAISDFSGIEARVLAWLAGENWVLRAVEEGRDLYVETAERMGGGMGRPEGKIAVLACGYQGSVGSLRNMGYGGRMCPFDKVKPSKRKNVYTGKDTESHATGTTGASLEEFTKRLAGLSPEDHKFAMDSEAVEWFMSYFTEEDLERDEVAAKVKAAIFGHISEMRRDPNHRCDFQIKAVVNAWRDANDHIRQFWYDLERKFWTGGRVGPRGRVRVEVDGGTRRVFLPSGRAITYHQVTRKNAVVIDEETGVERTKPQLKYRHINGYMDKTYGGRLTENVTQAVARDLLADAMLRLDQAGYYVVGHVHDEVVVESDDLEGIRRIMKTGPDWSEGLPLDASADLAERYTK